MIAIENLIGSMTILLHSTNLTFATKNELFDLKQSGTSSEAYKCK